MDPSLTGFYRVSQKLSDVIPVLQITPRATEPSTVSVFLSVKCGRVCMAQTCAHSGIKPSTLAKGLPQGGPKSSKKIRIFDHFVHLRPYISATVAYKQHTEKCFIHPPSNCRMCMNSSPTGFYRVVQKVSDVIPVLGIMSRLPFLFSWASSSVVAYVGNRPTHILAYSHPGWPRGFYRVGQKNRKHSNFWPFADFTYLSNR